MPITFTGAPYPPDPARLATRALTLVDATSSIQPARGVNNTASGNYSNILGGCGNFTTGCFAVVANGCSNGATGNFSVVGGRQNRACANFSIIAGGQLNNITSSGYSGTIAGGSINSVRNGYGTVVGGFSAQAIGTYAFVGGGGLNSASGYMSTVINGCCNRATGNCSTVVAGSSSLASGCASFVGSGFNNTASGNYSFIAGGANNNTRGLANTFILGTALSATKANYTYVNNLSVRGNIESNTNYVATLSLTANQTLPSAADTVLTLNPRNDPNNWFSITAGAGLTASRLTPNIPGFYNINYQVSWQPGVSATGAQNNIQIMKVSSGVPNTISIVQQPIANVSVNTAQNTSAITFMNGTTDYLYFQAYSSNSAQVVTGTTDGNWTKVEVFKIN